MFRTGPRIFEERMQMKLVARYIISGVFPLLLLRYFVTASLIQERSSLFRNIREGVLSELFKTEPGCNCLLSL